jgi:GNAT superfamily N-acetyltransferase
MKVEIKQITDSSFGLLKNLAIEAYSEGYSFVRRAIDDWKSGINDFSKEGEILLGIFLSNSCIGIGGLNIDPYIEDPGIGRVRHVYISQKHRRKGFATVLLRRIINMAVENFEMLRLYTDIPNAGSFYESLGFIQSSGIKVTHILKILKNKR